MQSSRDSIYATPLGQVDNFAFDTKVAEVFPDMISRSVPGYTTMVQTLGMLAARFAQPNTKVYDLGCSLGAVSIAMKQQIEVADVEIIGVDNSPAMVERCQTHVNAWRGATPVHIECADILDYELQPCSVVAMNFTLQFIPPEQRKALLTKIFNALQPGGVLLLSEKVKHSHALAEEVIVDLHHNFKRLNGYSELEIAQKRAAIEQVMRIDSAETHQQRLNEIGFNPVQNWYRCFNFTSWFACRP